MPVVDGVIVPLIPGQATVRIGDVDTSSLTADRIPNNATDRFEASSLDPTTVVNSSNVVATLEAKTGDDRLNNSAIKNRGGPKAVQTFGGATLDLSTPALIATRAFQTNVFNQAGTDCVVTIPDARSLFNEYPWDIDFVHLGGRSHTLTITMQGIAGIYYNGNQVRSIELRRGDRIRMVQDIQFQVIIVETSRVGAGRDYTGAPFLVQDQLANVSGASIVFSPAVSAANIGAHFAYRVSVGNADAFGREVVAGDYIISEQANPSLSTSIDTDWFVLSDTSGQGISPSDVIKLSRLSLVGGPVVRADANFQVDAANVRTLATTATGTPLVINYDVVDDPVGATARQAIQSSVIQLANIPDAGGALVVDLVLARRVNTQASGFLPEPTSISFIFGPHTFTASLNAVDPNSGAITVTATIPPGDYSAAESVNALVVFDYDFRGAEYHGAVIVNGLSFRSTGLLYASIQEIASQAADEVETRVAREIANVRDLIPTDESSVTRLESRVSPLRTVITDSLDNNDVYFLATTPTGPAPGALSELTRIDPDHATFTATSAAVFVAVGADVEHVLRNVTLSEDHILSTAGAQADADLSLEESFFDAATGRSYFVYRLVALIVGNELQVYERTRQEVAAWADDIAKLKAEDIAQRQRYDAEPLHNLSDVKKNWLANSFSIVQEASTSLVPTPLNLRLSGDNTQSFFPEGSPNSVVNDVLLTNPISSSIGDRRGHKFIGIAMTAFFDGAVLARARDNLQVLNEQLLYRNGENLALRRLLPAVPATSRTVTHYPSIATEDGGAGVWFNATLHTPDFQPEGTAVSLTRNLPGTATTVTIFVRSATDGTRFGTPINFNLLNVGGSTQTTATANLSLPNSGVVEVTAIWRPRSQQVEVSFVVTNPGNGLFIYDAQIRAEWTETITTPARPESFELVTIADYVEGEYEPILLSPSITPRTDGDASTLLIATRNGIWDTGWPFNTLFGSTDGGRYQINVQDGVSTPVIYDFEKAEIGAQLARTLYNSREAMFYGLFTEAQTIATDARSITPFMAPLRIRIETTDITLTSNDLASLVMYNDPVVAAALTIPTNTSMPVPRGWWTRVANINAGALTIQGATGVSLNGVAQGTVLINNPYKDRLLVKIATDDWVSLN